MTWPVRSPAICNSDEPPDSNSGARATLRWAPPPELLRQLREGEDNRPTAPGPRRARGRSRLLSAVFAAAIVAGGVGVARVFADADVIAH